MPTSQEKLHYPAWFSNSTPCWDALSLVYGKGPWVGRDPPFCVIEKLHEFLSFKKGDLTTFWDLRILILGNEGTSEYNSYQILNANHLFRIINILSKAPEELTMSEMCDRNIEGNEMTPLLPCPLLVRCRWFWQEILTKMASEQPW